MTPREKNLALFWISRGESDKISSRKFGLNNTPLFKDESPFQLRGLLFSNRLYKKVDFQQVSNMLLQLFLGLRENWVSSLDRNQIFRARLFLVTKKKQKILILYYLVPISSTIQKTEVLLRFCFDQP